MTDRPQHMTPAEFREHGHAVVDWIAQYMEQVEAYPVLSQVNPGDVFNSLPSHPPEHAESMNAMMRDLDELVLPGITHWQSPNFFAYYPANVSGPSILGELLSAGLGVQGMLWSTSPACTEIETRMLDWMVELLGLPETFLSSSSGGGVIQDSASSAGLCAMIAARERTTAGEGNTIGLNGLSQPLVAYCSADAHSSIEKGARIIGIGTQFLRLIPTDDEHRMRTDALEAAIEADLAAGRKPFFVAATVGTTACAAIDPVPKIASIARRHNIWLHIDGAMYGIASLLPECRWIHEGIELVDSYCVNAHKWMLTNFDCNCFWIRDKQALISALTILPEFLVNKATTSGGVIDYRDWQIPLGRRFRALKLWMVIRHYGAEGLRAFAREHIAQAQAFASWVDADQRFELMAPHPLTLVTFRHTGGDAINERMLEILNEAGKIYISHCKLAGKYVLRMAFGSAKTTQGHVEQAWALICQAAAQAESELS